MSRRVLIVGATGSFGSRLARGIVATTDLGLVLACRHPAHGAQLAQALRAHRPGAEIDVIGLDVETVSPDQLRAAHAFVVVDAAGPFQGNRYRLAEAAIAAQINYLDLADARGFVADFPRLDGAARQAGVTALTGASSTPALSNAVLDRLTDGWQRVDTVEIAISPGNRAPRGLSVVRAILSYAGRPVRVFDEGVWTVRPGWGMTARKAMGALGGRWLSLCETPDLDLVPARFQVQRSAIFKAGLELPVLHLGLVAASLLVRGGALRSLEPLARPLRAIAALLVGFGSDRGGMLVEASGRDAGAGAIRARWLLAADAGDGPTIPTLPALAAIRQLADGRLNRPGAAACVGVLALDDIEAEFKPYRIRTRTEVERPTV